MESEEEDTNVVDQTEHNLESPVGNNESDILSRERLNVTRSVPRLFLEAENTNRGRIIRLNRSYYNRNEQGSLGNMQFHAKESKDNDLGRNNPADFESRSTISVLSSHSINHEYSTNLQPDDVSETSKISLAANRSSSVPVILDMLGNEDNRIPLEIQVEKPHHHLIFTVGDASDSSQEMDDERECPLILTGSSLDELPPPPTYESLCLKTLHKDCDSEELMMLDDVEPPSYNDVTDAPPDYHTLFSQSLSRMMELANNGSSDNETGCLISSLKSFFLYTALFCIMCIGIGLLLVLPTLMIAVGVGNIHYCPAQPRLPIFLMSLGAFQLLETAIRFLYSMFKNRRQRHEQQRNRYNLKDPFLYFIVVWFVVGSMWAYQTYPTCYSIYDVMGVDIKDYYKDLGKDINKNLAVDKSMLKTETPYLGGKHNLTIQNASLNTSVHSIFNASVHNVFNASDNRQINGSFHGTVNASVNRTGNLSAESNINASNNAINASDRNINASTQSKINTSHSIFNTSFQTPNASTTKTTSETNKTNLHHPSNIPLKTTDHSAPSIDTRKVSNKPTQISLKTTSRPPKKNKAPCCAESVYMLTFVVVTMYYCILGLFVVLYLYYAFHNLYNQCRIRRSLNS